MKALEKIVKFLKGFGINEAEMKESIDYFTKRLEDNASLGEDVMQDCKTVDGCRKYVTNLAKKEAIKNCAVISNSRVYEWIEDYIYAEPEKEKKVEPKPVLKAVPKAPTPTKKKAKANEEVGFQFNMFDMSEEAKETDPVEEVEAEVEETEAEEVIAEETVDTSEDSHGNLSMF